MKRLIDMSLPGRKRRGMPKTRWKDAMVRDFEGVGLVKEWATDRRR